MMSRVWKVKIDEKDYEVKVKGSKVFVNNEKKAEGLPC